CSWAATSTASWISITAGASRSGNGQASFSVAANAATSDRTGTLTIAGQTVTVTQSGASGSASRSYTDDYPFPTAVINTVNPRWNFFYRECTDFLAWRLNKDAGTTSEPYFFTNNMGGHQWSNAENWDMNAQQLNFVVDHSPAVGAI